jgi:hypothetical protein
MHVTRTDAGTGLVAVRTKPIMIRKPSNNAQCLPTSLTPVKSTSKIGWSCWPTITNVNTLVVNAITYSGHQLHAPHASSTDWWAGNNINMNKCLVLLRLSRKREQCKQLETDLLAFRTLEFCIAAKSDLCVAVGDFSCQIGEHTRMTRNHSVVEMSLLLLLQACC